MANNSKENNRVSTAGFAVIETGGKQYRVAPGDKLRIEKLDNGEGDTVSFDKVLLKSDGKTAEIGTPYLSGVNVEAKVLSLGREKKKIVFKYKPKTRERKLKGHRQPYTEIEITKISA